MSKLIEARVIRLRHLSTLSIFQKIFRLPFYELFPTTENFWDGGPDLRIRQLTVMEKLRWIFRRKAPKGYLTISRCRGLEISTLRLQSISCEKSKMSGTFYDGITRSKIG